MVWWNFDCLIDWLIDSFLHSFLDLVSFPHGGAAGHTRSSHCSLSIRSPWGSWYLMIFAFLLIGWRFNEGQSKSCRWYKAAWSKVVTMTMAPQTPPVWQFPSMVGLFAAVNKWFVTIVAATLIYFERVCACVCVCDKMLGASPTYCASSWAYA